MPKRIPFLVQSCITLFNIRSRPMNIEHKRVNRLRHSLSFGRGKNALDTRTNRYVNFLLASRESFIKYKNPSRHFSLTSISTFNLMSTLIFKQSNDSIFKSLFDAFTKSFSLYLKSLNVKLFLRYSI